MLNIAIVGAGPAGLTLARLLLKSSIASSTNIVIFEKDTSSTSRRSIGGTLDLHPQTGLAAIRAMDLWDEFMKYARFEGEEIRFCDMNGMVYVHQTDAPQIEGFDARPEIDRVRLMEVLMNSVPGNMIKWGKQVKEVSQKDTTSYLTFEDGTTEGPFDLIVGADGAWSKVRKALTDVSPTFSGICSVAGTITKESAGDRWEDISAMIGKGSNFVSSYGKSMVGQRMGDGSIKCGFHQKRDQQWLETLKNTYGKDQEGMKRVLLEEYRDWVPEFKYWITASTDLWCTTLWELPVGVRFKHKAGLTLMADAAHLMTPFAGEGVNAAMKDALELTTALEGAMKEHDRVVDEAVQGFEESMFKRAEVFMAKTLSNKEGMFAQDSPYSFFVNMTGIVAQELGWSLDKGMMYWIPVKRVMYGIFWSMGTFGALRRRIVDVVRRRS